MESCQPKLIILVPLAIYLVPGLDKEKCLTFVLQHYSEDDEKVSEPEHYRKIFIGGLDFKTTDESLKQHFEKFGEIVDVVVMKDPQTRK